MDHLGALMAGLAPWVVQGALALMILEALLLWRLARRRPLPPGLAWHVASGAGLMLALRAVHDGEGASAVVWMGAAGACHAMALWRSVTRAEGGA